MTIRGDMEAGAAIGAAAGVVVPARVLPVLSGADGVSAAAIALVGATSAAHAALAAVCNESVQTLRTGMEAAPRAVAARDAEGAAAVTASAPIAT